MRALNSKYVIVPFLLELAVDEFVILTSLYCCSF